MTDAGPGSGSFAPLRERLHEVNHWWPDTDAEYQPDRPGSIPAAEAWDFYRSDFIGALDKLAWSDDQPRLFAMAGPENTGKTTILSQMLRLFVDDDFRKLLWELPESRDAEQLARGPLDLRAAWAIDRYHYRPVVESAHTNLVDQLSALGPDRVLYLPLGADPSFQLRPEKQLREAVEYYEAEILDGDPAETRHYVFVDDVHTLGSDGADGGWGELVADLVEGSSPRKVVATTISDEAVEEALYDPERDEMRLDPDSYTVENVVSSKFRDYLQRRYPIFEGADTGARVDLDYTGALSGDWADSGTGTDRDPNAYRISGSDLSRGISRAVTEDDPSVLFDPASDDDPLTAFDAQLEEIYDWIGSGARDSPRAWIRNALEEYLLLGGYLSLSLDDDLFGLPNEEFRAYLRGEGEHGGRNAFAADAREALDGTLGSIHEQVPAFESIRQHRTRDLSRLFAWAGHTLETDPFDYDDLLGERGESGDWILDVDRRTLREKYFDTLEQMVLLTFSDGYGHKKPRELRVALRDVGLANALHWRDLDDVADGEIRTSLEYMVAFDHVMRFSYNVNHPRDPNVGVVRYWQDGDDFVEFVPKFWGAPVPIGFDTTSDAPLEKIDAVGRFLDVQSADPDAEVHDFVRYEPAVGEPRTGPAGNVKKLRGWFDESVLETLAESNQVESLGDVWAASADELAEIEGIDAETATELVEAVELYDVLADVRGVGPSKQETLWNPPAGSGDAEDHRPSPDQPHWTVDELARADPSRIAAIEGFTATTAERVVQAARTRQQQQVGESEYARRLDLLLDGDDGWWPGIDDLGAEGESRYQGRYEKYEWGQGETAEDEGTADGDGPVHHRIHDGEAPFGIVLTSGSKVERYESPEEEKPIFTVPLWMFLSLA